MLGIMRCGNDESLCEDEVKGRKPVASDHSGRNMCIYINTEAITTNRLQRHLIPCKERNGTTFMFVC